ncbi:MAG TPA: peptidoglycan DD-metalloendopeptidase family protein [bacterium]|nr:peptidoglycan DD-metalloendopeptidase family protein [bacterium]
MQRKKILFTIFIALFAFLVPFSDLVFAQDTGKTETEEGNEDEIEELQEKIEKYEKKLSELRSKANTLQNEIDYMDNQIGLTELKIRNSIANIRQTESKINELAEGIDNLGIRIEKLEKSIDYQEKVLGARMRERYKDREKNMLMLVFGGDALSSLVKKTKYLQDLEENDRKLIDQMAATKSDFQKQKEIFEDKKSEQESLKKKLEIEKANLDSYKMELENNQREKEEILKQTENDEERYQELLNQAIAERNAMQGIVSSVNFKNGTKVEKGDVIAIMGNSGSPYCSTGTHLHFEIRKGNSVVNAEKYLKKKNLYVWHYSNGYTDIGSGSWEWPMKSPEITQRYGKTPWSWRYPNKIHEGIDMTSNDVFIRAPKGGTMIKGGMGCGGAIINYVAIDHGDDVVSYYLHIK